jgi:integrase
MARRVRNADVETREARRKLKRKGVPYWTRLEEGLHLGYRRQKGTGKWVVRHYLGKDVRWVYRGKEAVKSYEMKVIGVADDFTDADGVKVLTFDQAQRQARELMKRRAFAAAGVAEGPYTVRRAIDDYVTYLKASGKDHRWTQMRAAVHILPTLGDIEVEALTSERIRKWLSDLADTPARIRTKVGMPQRFRQSEARPRKSSANRTFTILRAALNFAFDERKVSSNHAWGRRVKMFKSVDGKRDRYLEIDEARRLINACNPDFRDLVLAALQTGCRFGELVRLTVSDFKRDGGTVHVQRSKSGKERYVVLTDEGIAFFTTLCKGRSGAEPMLSRAWNRNTQRTAFQATLDRAKIKPPITFHGLRHTWASHAVMGGVPLIVVAQSLGHSDTRMVERHYGHLAASFVADAIRAGAPRFGVIERDNVEEIGRGRRR